MVDRWDQREVPWVHYHSKIGYSGVAESAIVTNQRHHAKRLLKENTHY